MSLKPLLSHQEALQYTVQKESDLNPVDFYRNARDIRLQFCTEHDHKEFFEGLRMYVRNFNYVVQSGQYSTLRFQYN